MIGPRQLKSEARQCAIVSARELWLRERAIAPDRVGVRARDSPRQCNPKKHVRVSARCGLQQAASETARTFPSRMKSSKGFRHCSNGYASKAGSRESHRPGSGSGANLEQVNLPQGPPPPNYLRTSNLKRFQSSCPSGCCRFIFLDAFFLIICFFRLFVWLVGWLVVRFVVLFCFALFCFCVLHCFV